MTKALARIPAARLARAPMPLVAETVELEDAFDDDSLEMNEDGDKFRVKRYHKVRRIIGVSEQTFDTTGFEVLDGCTVPIPEKAAMTMYKFRAQVVYETNDVAEGMAARMAFDGVLFGQHRYRVSMGDSLTTAVKTRFEVFGATPTPEAGGPGAALGWAELEGTFAVDPGSSGTLAIEIASETGGANWSKAITGTYLEVMQCS